MNIKSSQDVVNQDMEYICSSLKDEFEQMAGKSLLITGGAGFLGYYLVQSVLFWNEHNTDNKKIKITVYDNYMRGIPAWLDVVKQDHYMKLVKHDIVNPLPEDIGSYQFIIHAASIASPHYYRKYPLETMDANVGGLRYLLEYARELKEKGEPVEGFLFFSTSEIYGDPDPGNIPTTEFYRGNVSCTGPRACYDESKRFGETLCVTFAEQYDLPVKIARPFNNYGPGLKITDKRVIPDFMRDVLANRDIMMYSDGNPSRTFCYIADAVTGYFKVLVKGRKGEAYNIGVEKPEISMKELADTIAEVAGRYSDYGGKVVQARSNDSNYLIDNPNRRCPDITKAHKGLKYDPKISIEDGLMRTFVWYVENQEAVEA
ncbi:MAG: NAD-dependent epimerase/dehydratase family protein [Balneolales bacterium]